MTREKIFRPLSMTSTDLRSREDKAGLQNMAWGHLFVAEKQAYVNADSFPAFNYTIWLGEREGPGRVSGSAPDLLKWDQALYRETLVKNETLAKAFEPAKLNNGKLSQYGFGFMLGHHVRLGRKVFHTGDNPGYKTIFIRYIDANKLVVLLCNNEHPRFNDVVAAIQNALSRA
jgi:CubicO group peptidase (beta-lactamase class C family)